MKPQTAQVSILAAALVGTLLVIEREGQEPERIRASEGNLYHLKPGDTFTVRVESDQAWVDAQERAEQADQAAREASKAQAETQTADDSTRTGMTLDQGLAITEARPVVPPAALTPTTEDAPIPAEDPRRDEQAKPGNRKGHEKADKAAAPAAPPVDTAEQGRELRAAEDASAGPVVADTGTTRTRTSNGRAPRS
jgi:hypothetical protein